MLFSLFISPSNTHTRPVRRATIILVQGVGRHLMLDREKSTTSGHDAPDLDSVLRQSKRRNRLLYAPVGPKKAINTGPCASAPIGKR